MKALSFALGERNKAVAKALKKNPVVSGIEMAGVAESDTDEKRMRRLCELMTQGAFRPAIDSIHPLANAADAFARQQEPGKHGKILIDLA